MNLRLPTLMAVLAVTASWGHAEPAAPLSALARMPVKEITVFKDGHAFVLHQGRMPTDGAGNVLLDYLPTPVLGTFWPYSADKNVSLTAVTASQRRVRVERTALTLPELLEANPGADVMLTDGLSAPGFGPPGAAAPGYPAQIVGVPERSAEESAATGPPSSEEKLPQQGNVILLKTSNGVSVLPLDRFQSITFKGAYKPTLADEEFRSLLTLRLDWHGHAPAKTADVGMLYLQKGIRWIPSYKITIDGDGNALVKLQATLINEMTDLSDVTANLVVGVPTFAFQSQADPIGLQQTLAQLSPYFSADAATANGFSNAVMGQAGGFSAYNRQSRAGENVNTVPGGLAGIGDTDTAVSDASKNEDFFIFTVKHVTLGRGQRMVLPVAEYPLKYKDVYTLDLPYAPPPEVRSNYNADQQSQLARLLASPKVMHKLRLINHSSYPLTTAPALILRNDRVLAQGLMTYAAVNATVDLDLTTAVDIQVKKTEKVMARVPNVEKWLGNSYGRVDLAGRISLTNFGARPVDLEVTRQVLGTVGTADNGGVAEMLNTLENEDAVPAADYPIWWGWYGLPPWWSHFNGTGRIRWTVPLAPQKPTELGYTWSYTWQ